jgi:hypothetical protein
VRLARHSGDKPDKPDKPAAGADDCAAAGAGAGEGEGKKMQGMDEWFMGEIHVGVQGAVSTAQWLMGGVDAVWGGVWGSGSSKG